MFNKILVVVKDYLKEEGEKVVEEVEKILEGRNYSLMKFNGFKDSDLKDVEFVIAIGGDGTFLKLANHIQEAYLLGINPQPHSSEGALTGMSSKNLDKLKDILDGKFNTIIRQRAIAIKNGKPLKGLALNEIYIGATNQFHTARYKIKFRGVEEEHRSSGVIIATGCGSTAWYGSAGGENFDCSEPLLKFLVREPYVRELFKPKLLKGEVHKGEKIVFEDTSYNSASIAIDSNEVYEFERGDVVEISLVDKPLKVIVPLN